MDDGRSIGTIDKIEKGKALPFSILSIVPIDLPSSILTFSPTLKSCLGFCLIKGFFSLFLFFLILFNFFSTSFCNIFSLLSLKEKKYYKKKLKRS